MSRLPRGNEKFHGRLPGGRAPYYGPDAYTSQMNEYNFRQQLISIREDLRPAVLYRTRSGASGLTTSLTTLDFDVSVVADSGYRYSSGVVTIENALDGKLARIDWSVEGAEASDRSMIESYLQVDTGSGFTTVKTASNYATRNLSQDSGFVAGFHYLTLSAGDLIRVQVKLTGDSLDNVSTGTSLAIETKN